jgi:hypothetical protein
MMQHPLPAKVGTNFTDKWRSLGLYNSLVDYGHGGFLLVFLITYLLVSAAVSSNKFALRIA